MTGWMDGANVGTYKEHMADSQRMLLLMIKPPAFVAEQIRALPGVDKERRVDLLHQTILPIGERAEAGQYLDAVADALGGLDTRPFEACFDRIVATPGRAAKLVPSGRLPEQRRLHRGVVSVLDGKGVGYQPYKFAPHVTLHYDWQGAALKQEIEPIRWLVDTLLLVESFHGKARHEELGRWPLRPRQGTLFPYLSCAMETAQAA